MFLKKSIKFAVFLAAAMPFLASAQSGKTAPESDFQVKLNKTLDGCIITAYTGAGGDVVIPAAIQGLPVLEVDLNPPKIKSRNTTVVSVVIPDGVTTIEQFNECQNLVSVTIPGSVKNFGEWTAGTGAGLFKDCVSLKTITLPAGTKKITGRMFDGCTSLTSLTIPDGVTEIGDYAFNNSGIKSVNIPDSVMSIGQYAFSNCANLAEVSISPVNGRKWGGNNFSAFNNCPKLGLASQAALKKAGYNGNF